VLVCKRRPEGERKVESEREKTQRDRIRRVGKGKVERKNNEKFGSK
jgi:hypothetical protein